MGEESILVIEDNLGIAEFVNQVLGTQYKLRFAQDGLEGLRDALADPPDLILLDQKLPGLSGLEVLKALREHKLDVPVILHTAYGSESTVVEALRLGAHDYLTKPFMVEELLRSVERALENHRLRREREFLIQKLHALNQNLRKLYQDSHRQAQMLATINRIGRSVTSSLELSQVFQAVVRSVNEILSVQAGSIALLDETGQQLIFYITLEGDTTRLSAFRLKVGEGIIGWVVQNRLPARVNDVQNDPRFYAGIDRSIDFETHSVLCVPLIVADRAIGAIEVINKINPAAPSQRALFTEQDEILLRAVASFVAMAIENARLYDRMRTTVAVQTVQDTMVTLAHHINNPLQVLLNLAHHLERCDGTGQTSRLIEQQVNKIVAVLSILQDVVSPQHTLYMGNTQMFDIEQELEKRLSRLSERGEPNNALTTERSVQTTT